MSEVLPSDTAREIQERYYERPPVIASRSEESHGGKYAKKGSLFEGAVAVR